jgi:hypothetical protein
MIELTTGVVFLMSSLYGAGQHGYEANAVAAVTETEEAAVTETIDTSDTGTLKDPKAIEAYLRKEFAETPILIEVARCESTFRQFTNEGKVVQGIVDKRDTGVMQINTYYHGETAKKLGMDLHTLEGNVAYAKYLHKKYGTKPWSASQPCWSNAELASK